MQKLIQNITFFIHGRSFTVAVLFAVIFYLSAERSLLKNQINAYHTVMTAAESKVETVTDAYELAFDYLDEISNYSSLLNAGAHAEAGIMFARRNGGSLEANGLATSPKLLEKLPGKNLNQRLENFHEGTGQLLSLLKEVRNQLRAEQHAIDKIPSLQPAEGWISSRYGRRKSPIVGKVLMHQGIDIAARKGTPIVAAAGGRVVTAGWSGGFGRLVEIDHGNGMKTRYAHGSKLLVKKGQTVQRGQKIALVGLSGRTTGAHLHYEVRFKGRPLNPKLFLALWQKNLKPGNAEALNFAVNNEGEGPMGGDPEGADLVMEISNAERAAQLTGIPDASHGQAQLVVLVIALSLLLYGLLLMYQRGILSAIAEQIKNAKADEPREFVHERIVPVSFWEEKKPSTELKIAA